MLDYQEIKDGSYGACFLFEDELIDSFVSPISGDEKTCDIEDLFGFEGFIEVWTIQNNKLSLIGLVGKHSLKVEFPVVADWFSGVVMIPMSDEYYQSPLSVGSLRLFSAIYMKELYLSFEKGELVLKDCKEYVLTEKQVTEKLIIEQVVAKTLRKKQAGEEIEKSV